MWFKNLLMYRLTQELDFSNLEEALGTKRAKPCTFQELSSYGFVAPYGKSEDAPLVHCRQGFYLIAARKEERIMPASVINKELRKKVDEIEARDNRKVYKKEKDQLKDEIVQSILPKALIKESITYAVIAPKLELILVDTTSTAKAENLLSTLREALGSLPIRPFATKIDIATTLTGWLHNQQAHTGFTILEDCQLEDCLDTKGIIRCKNQDLSNETILDHLKSGMLVTSLSLNWKNKLSFVLDKKLGIKRIKFDDVIFEEASKDGGDDEASQFDANFILMMFTLAEFIPELIQALGGDDEITPIEKPSSTFDQFSLYDEAVAIVKASGNAGTSHLQRQLKVGYNHASILLERMERELIVSAQNSMTGKRTVLSPTS